MPSTLGIQIEQSVLLHHRNTRRHRPQRINALFLQCQLHRIGRIARQLHLFHFHPQIRFVQPGCFQFLPDERQLNRIGVGLYYCNSIHTVFIQNTEHFIYQLS